MNEIFIRENSPGAEVVRSTNSSVMLKAPAEISFGKATPGIAFYEKSGADLSVTLLDQSVILIRNFFAIGADGQASRLIKADGGVEVTGLIAPEPFVPRDEVPQIVQIEKPVEEVAQAAPPAPPSNAIVTSPIGESGESSQAAEGDAGQSGGDGTLFGLTDGAEIMAFAGGNALLLWAGLRGSDDDSTEVAAADAAMDPALAALVLADEAPIEATLRDADFAAFDDGDFAHVFGTGISDLDLLGSSNDELFDALPTAAFEI